MTSSSSQKLCRSSVGKRRTAPSRVSARTGQYLAAAAVLGIHAASQGVAPEFALPLYPLFIVTALAALAGDRGPARLSSA